MSGEEGDDDKQYEATQHKLDEARKKGDFPRSADLNTSAAYAGILLVGMTVGAGSLVGLGGVFTGILARSDQLSDDLFSASGRPLGGGILTELATNMSPFFLAPACLVILALIAQRGIVFAPSKLEFKLSRISPISQAKNKFGRSGLFEFAKSFAKLLLYSTVLFLFLAGRLPEIMGTIRLAPGQVVATLLGLCVSLMSIVLIIAISLGGVDFVWQKAEHARKNRMSRKELTDESKNAEGDPALKQKRRQKGVEIAMNQMLADVPDADVIIVNPTHYAVALKWDRMKNSAPVCIAKGVDLVALRIREVAQENSIPIQSDPPTARALHATIEIGDQIPRDHYKAVAAAIRFADRIRKATKR